MVDFPEAAATHPAKPSSGAAAPYPAKAIFVRLRLTLRKPFSGAAAPYPAKPLKRLDRNFKHFV